MFDFSDEGVWSYTFGMLETVDIRCDEQDERPNEFSSPMVGMLEVLFSRRSDKPLVPALVTLALPGSKGFVLEFNQQDDSQLPLALAGPGCCVRTPWSLGRSEQHGGRSPDFLSPEARSRSGSADPNNQA